MESTKPEASFDEATMLGQEVRSHKANDYNQNDDQTNQGRSVVVPGINKPSVSMTEVVIKSEQYDNMSNAGTIPGVHGKTGVDQPAVGGFKDIIKKMQEAGRSKNDIISALKTQLSLLETSQKKPEPMTEGIIRASSIHDPGLKDRFGTFKQQVDEKREEPMHNLELVPNDQGLVTSEFEDHPACKELFSLRAEWSIEDRKRNFVLIIEDMQKGYFDWIDYVAPNVHMLLEKFREKGLPVVWTNWSRFVDDDMYCAIDRFYGPRGVTGEHGEMNPCYLYGKDADKTIDLLAPSGPDEMSRMIASYHLNKFADLDADGREILYPMFEAWGIDTIILAGAWTDDCLVATAFDAVDRYGYDVVLVKDGVATATIHGGKMVECLGAACCLPQKASDICKHIDEHPNLVAAPRAPLRGEVRFTVEKQKR